MDFHKYADIFPLMSNEEIQDLATDIQAHGLMEPIWTYEGEILDGRNRYLACLDARCVDAGIEPDFVEYKGDDPVSFVVSLNLIRRHLNPVQRASIGVAILPMLQEEAEKRARTRTDVMDETDAKIFASEAGRGSDKAGQKVGVSGRMVEQAAQLAQDRPDIFQKMQEGKIPSMSFAEELINVTPEAVNGVIAEYEKRVDEQGKRSARQWVRGKGTGTVEPTGTSAVLEVEEGYQLIFANLEGVSSPALHQKYQKWALRLVKMHEERGVDG